MTERRCLVSSADNLKKEAKRWLKALRAKEPDARARLTRAWTAAPEDPVLRDVQHALAREHGHESWAALKAAIAATPREATAGGVPAEAVAAFLTDACWDHHTHGKSDHRMYDRAAERLLAQHPRLARHSLYTAVVCGDIEEVRRILAERPAAAREPGGSRGWTPILYATYTRFTHKATIDNGVEIARLLLDHGANVNDFYMAGDSQYSTLVGAAGEGEQDSPRQPYAAELYQLLLERGAEPYDIQVLYNTHFSCDMIWWLELTYRHTLKMGRRADWEDPAWSMLNMGGYGPGAYFILNAAVQRDHLALAGWALEHGAGPNVRTSSHPKFKPAHTVYDVAVMQGLTDMAALLRRHGAASSGGPIEPEQAFIAACMRLDRPAAQALIDVHPEFRQSHRAMFTAAERDRPDVIALLLDLGVPLEVADAHNARALHHAASGNAVRAAKFLIERGAEIDSRESRYGGTPIGWAAHGDRRAMMDLLSQYTCDVWTLAFHGYLDRLREVLREEPALARLTDSDGCTPLWWLPDDEEKAMDIVEPLLAAGADPAAKNRAGRTAADWARKRGMTDVARRLGFEGQAEAPPSPPTAPDLPKYESLAQDLVFAFETGRADSMARLMDHFGGEITWEGLRKIVRQRLDNLGERRPEGYFALPHARALVASQAGFSDWASLTAAVSSAPVESAAHPIVLPPPEPADVPVEMRMAFPMRLHDGTVVPTTTVWRMLAAAREGDLATVTALVDECPSLVFCDYNYMPPLHLAVREGHLEIVRFLADRGAVNPNHRTYPYNETLLMVAADRGFTAIAGILEDYGRGVDPDRPGDENGKIDCGRDPERHRFEQLVNANALGAVEALLNKRPELAIDPFAFWSEGVLMMPAHDSHTAMIELLMRYGARVPDMTKWCREYYFKSYDTAAFLMERGMNPNHMNWERTTLLHGMAQLGNVRKATLLLDHGAEIDAVDDEFRSTPLGLAARWGHQEMVRFLLDRGADKEAAGAGWARPIEWARKKGHNKIEADLL
jgi:ankyrin repeat protein